jgi:hypothetical protein
MITNFRDLCHELQVQSLHTDPNRRAGMIFAIVASSCTATRGKIGIAQRGIQQEK